MLQWVMPSDVARTHRVWSPRDIGWASVLVGFPGAFVLAALNWFQMGRSGKAVINLAAAIATTWALVLLHAGSVGLLVGVASAIYLYRAQRADQRPLAAAGRLTAQSGLAGLVVAIVSTLLIVGSALIPTSLASIDPWSSGEGGTVMFTSTQLEQTCPPDIWVTETEFDQTDQIFFFATMRERVPAEAYVAYELEGPNGTSGPISVNAEPPFLCLVAQSSIGPLEPGTYTLRFRYADHPNIPDLAGGTFTVMPAGQNPSSPTAAPSPAASGG